LLIERGLGPTRFVLRSRPKPRGVWRKSFIDPNQVAILDAELEFGVGKEDAARLGVGRGATIDVESDGSNFFGERLADDFRGAIEGNVFIMAAGRLGGGSENRFREFIGFPEARGQQDAANFATGLVLPPTGSGQIAAGDTFDREGPRFADDHGTTGECVEMSMERRREVGGAQDVVGNDLAELMKPEERELREDATLVGDCRGHNDVESGKAVGGDDEQFIAQVIDIANFAARDGRETGKVSFAKHLGFG